ncbi:hypothetical protein HUJ05_008120 [Dendroctonus ponderosae]|nr:hypothetical protein HUJ05_008120 [Dendroctonus ponderosae]
MTTIWGKDLLDGTQSPANLLVGSLNGDENMLKTKKNQTRRIKKTITSTSYRQLTGANVPIYLAKV